MNLDALFPTVFFTSAEMKQIAKAVTHHSAVKYFKSQQALAFKAIANGLPKEGETDANYLRRQAQVIGQLQVWEALLAIEKPPESDELLSQL